MSLYIADLSFEAFVFSSPTASVSGVAPSSARPRDSGCGRPRIRRAYAPPPVAQIAVTTRRRLASAMAPVATDPGNDLACGHGPGLQRGLADAAVLGAALATVSMSRG